jgi:hypothetical protein
MVVGPAAGVALRSLLVRLVLRRAISASSAMDVCVTSLPWRVSGPFLSVERAYSHRCSNRYRCVRRQELDLVLRGLHGESPLQAGRDLRREVLEAVAGHDWSTTIRRSGTKVGSVDCSDEGVPQHTRVALTPPVVRPGPMGCLRLSLRSLSSFGFPRGGAPPTLPG